MILYLFLNNEFTPLLNNDNYYHYQINMIKELKILELKKADYLIVMY